jgi:SpoVK/Ycf46/Vps4 family AAA+-type ATPase
MTEGYSCADMQAMIKEAAMFPVREINRDELLKIKDSSAIRKLNVGDFQKAVKSCSASVSKHTI